MSKYVWWATTAVLVLVVAITVIDVRFFVPKTQDGDNTYRWYDGTLSKVEHINEYTNRLETRTLFGEDGKTIILHEEYDPHSGHLSNVQQRLEDGRMLFRDFAADGKTLVTESIYSPDQSVHLEWRKYRGGKLYYEETWSDDGKIKTGLREFYDNGTLKIEKIMDNTGTYHILKQFPTGKLQQKGTLSITGSCDLKTYYEDGVTVQRERLEQRDVIGIKNYLKDGKLKRSIQANLGKDLLAEYYDDKGVIKYRQKWVAGSSPDSWTLEQIDDYTDGKLVRTVLMQKGDAREIQHFDAQEKLTSKRYFRSGGTLEKEETFDQDGKSVKTEEFTVAQYVTEYVSYTLREFPRIDKEFDEN